MSDLDGVVKEFLIESHENLDQLDRDLLALEQKPRDGERLASVFRTIHTIKGTCGFFDFTRLGTLTHAGESLLSQLRDGTLLLNGPITTALLALVDAVRKILARIETTGGEGDEDHAALIATLTGLQAGAPRCSADTAGGQPLVVQESRLHTAAANPEGTRSPGEVLPAAAAESTIRVDVKLLDRLMTLVGELVLARNQLLQVAATRGEPALLTAAQRLNQITGELQEGVVKTRMQPIGNIWKTFPRLARDVALACGKQVRIDLEGEETELDKTVLEAIKDPLTHLVRNAIDHGIEPPEVRAARGKPVEGHLLLRAFHEGGQVHLEIGDDGGGIDPERVKQKALERGLLTPAQAERLAGGELLELVFLPGFSTAERVTGLSGRGVGMDVVKTNIEKIGGTVELESAPGCGTVAKVKIPLTLAIVPALIVTCGGDRYALPRGSLLELVRLEAEQVRRRIEDLYGAPVYRLRGNLLPLARLDRVLGVEAHQSEKDGVTLVVLQAGGRPFGLVVDGVGDTEEIVVKPLTESLRGLAVYAGATILGDGRVALILDVPGVAQRAGVIAEARGQVSPAVEERPSRQAAQSLLVCAAKGGRRVAIPLAQVERLEVLEPAAIEWAGGREVVQYRGGLLPLVRLREMPGPDAGSLHVVVVAEAGRRVGLIVERILDTAEELAASGSLGLPGAAIVQQRVTELVDLPTLLRGVEPALFALDVPA